MGGLTPDEQKIEQAAKEECFELHGCFTGDCPHDKVWQCAEHFFKAGVHWRDANPPPLPADLARVWDMWDDFVSNGMDWNRSRVSLFQHEFGKLLDARSAFEDARVRKLVEALEEAAKNVTWFQKASDGNDVLMTYGYHIEKCQKALREFRGEG